jgi:putative FmdB family regulatory protein
MPLYDFLCPNCGNTASEYRPLAQFNDPMVCELCQEVMDHDIVAQHASVRGNYARPIRLESMGFIADPEDVAEHRRRFPDVDLVFEDGSAIPIIRSLGQKKAYFKAAGLADMKSFG